MIDISDWNNSIVWVEKAVWKEREAKKREDYDKALSFCFPLLDFRPRPSCYDTIFLFPGFQSARPLMNGCGDLFDMSLSRKVYWLLSINI